MATHSFNSAGERSRKQDYERHADESDGDRFVPQRPERYDGSKETYGDTNQDPTGVALRPSARVFYEGHGR